MRVLGIDPGSRFLGFGIVEAELRGFRHIAHGVICTDEKAPLASRLADIYGGLSEAFARYRPEAVAVEGVFHHRNARSALILGHARGVALLIAAQSGFPVHEYAPARVKKSVGAGGADGKGAVARMVQTILGLKEPVGRADASDALAVAICHLNSSRFHATPSGTGTRATPNAALALLSAKKRGRGARDFAQLAGRISPSYTRAVTEKTGT